MIAPNPALLAFRALSTVAIPGDLVPDAGPATTLGVVDLLRPPCAAEAGHAIR